MMFIRSGSFNLCAEITVRVILLAVFCYMETISPYVRVILPSELEDCKYPRHETFMSATALWYTVLAVPLVLSIWSWAVLNDVNDAVEILLSWSLAFALNGIVTDGLKVTVGRPRPDYYYRCFHDGVATENLQCTGDPQDIMEGRKSFPSGHSSLSFCSLGFAALWLCGRLLVLSRRRGSALRVVTCAVPLLAAAGVGLSRICDYHHHWQDVVTGSVLGFGFAVFSYRQYYNPLSSDLAGVPYLVSNAFAKYSKMESPEQCLNPDQKESKMESTPLLNGRKEDKWI